jgi:hypothetical protein
MKAITADVEKCARRWEPPSLASQAQRLVEDTCDRQRDDGEAQKNALMAERR